MENKEKKGVVKTVVDGLVESTKLQHEITKERHAYANKPPIEKQKLELEELKRKNNS